MSMFMAINNERKFERKSRRVALVSKELHDGCKLIKIV